MELDGQRTQIRKYFPELFIKGARRDIRNFTPELGGFYGLRARTSLSLRLASRAGRSSFNPIAEREK